MTRLHFILAGSLLGLLALIGAFFYGVGVGVDRQQARDFKALQKAERALQKVVRVWAAHDAAAASADVARETKFREINREVPALAARPVYRNVCVDADGVRLLERAVAAANGEQPTVGGPDGDPGEIPKSADRR